MIPLIKLDAIDSTNEFLKRWTNERQSQSPVAVQASYQNQGRGQRGNQWVSEPSKNLILSVYTTLSGVLASRQFDLNKLISLTMIEMLSSLQIPDLAIKWPNDILSCRQKIGGILIETAVKNTHLDSVVIGIGLNVNQLFFEGLTNVSSLALVAQKEFEVDVLCRNLLDRLEQKLIPTVAFDESKLHKDYLSHLYGYQSKLQFKTPDGSIFEGIIVGVCNNGQLQVQTAMGLQEFSIKEVALVW